MTPQNHDGMIGASDVCSELSVEIRIDSGLPISPQSDVAAIGGYVHLQAF
jgi:hypothetical protein